MSREEEFQTIKTILRSDLEKIGLSLEAFDAALEHGMLKEAGDLAGGLAARAGDLVDYLGRAVGGTSAFAAKYAPDLLMTGSMLAGVTGGGLAYAANKSLDNEDKELNERKALVDRYKQLTHNVKSDYGIR